MLSHLVLPLGLDVFKLPTLQSRSHAKLQNSKGKRHEIKMRDYVTWWMILNKALNRWQTIIMKRKNVEYRVGDWDNFAKFLNPEANANAVISAIDDELVHKIKTIAGHHGETVLRAMDIRNGTGKS